MNWRWRAVADESRGMVELDKVSFEWNKEQGYCRNSLWLATKNKIPSVTTNIWAMSRPCLTQGGDWMRSLFKSKNKTFPPISDIRDGPDALLTIDRGRCGSSILEIWSNVGGKWAGDDRTDTTYGTIWKGSWKHDGKDRRATKYRPAVTRQYKPSRSASSFNTPSRCIESI